ncbi:conserved hypothetical protein [Hyella patelloides LEGE 07179]|uniref:Pyruvate/2-oxoglutarate dehydrogenase complex,dihydrolipoamide dehydrogenase (E3) component n=1 Tax=Hyella patelloides LEGE 07179 TaxID=945734 RepID=A0A563VV79_9CYAN|nr:DUF4330 domain-containing protein [Hyella patelloides]VEP15307.1 conserved hypothetical protein [Hyella patelloides LEGE 07179]
MKIIDSKGRLFGKVSILDLGAAGVILLAVAGIFFFPGTSVIPGVAQSNVKSIEVEVLVRGLSAGDFDGLLAEFQEDKQASIVIRNQPAGTVEILDTERLPRTTPVPQPDGTVKALPDPRPEVALIHDMVLTFGSQAQVTSAGVVIEGTKKLKIGTPIRLEGRTYDFNGSVITIRTDVET